MERSEIKGRGEKRGEERKGKKMKGRKRKEGWKGEELE